MNSKAENTGGKLAGPQVTRRRLLQQAGCVIAAAAISPDLSSATAQTVPAAGNSAAGSTVMEKLSTYMSEAQGTPAAWRSR